MRLSFLQNSPDVTYLRSVYCVDFSWTMAVSLETTPDSPLSWTQVVPETSQSWAWSPVISVCSWSKWSSAFSSFCILTGWRRCIKNVGPKNGIGLPELPVCVLHTKSNTHNINFELIMNEKQTYILLWYWDSVPTVVVISTGLKRISLCILYHRYCLCYNSAYFWSFYIWKLWKTKKIEQTYSDYRI